MFKADGNLKRIYNAYNRDYFDGQLPDAKVGYSVEVREDGCWGKSLLFEETSTGVQEWFIALAPDLKQHGDWKRVSLLHECAHLHLFPYEGHGKKFNDEIGRLFGRGAFIGLI